MSTPFRVGLKARVYNYNLDEALTRMQKRLGIPRYKLCEQLGLPYSQIAAYLRFKSFPREDRRLKLAIALETPVDSLWPEEISQVRVKQPAAVALTREQAISRGLVRGEEDPFEEVTRREDLPAAINTLLEYLPRRQRLVLEMRFGLNGYEPHVYHEVGVKMGVTRDRIRQIEAQALHTLRDPRVARDLYPYVWEDYVPPPPPPPPPPPRPIPLPEWLK